MSDTAQQKMDKEAILKALKTTPNLLEQEEILPWLPFKDEREGVSSLIERQVQLLRTQNQMLEKQLQSFYQEAKRNEGLLDGLKVISSGLLRVQCFDDLIKAVPRCLEQDFHIDKAKISVIDFSPLDHRVILPLEAENGFYLGESFEALNTHWFEDQNIKSVAIVALQAKEKVLGHLFLGSYQETTFIADLSTDFLDWAGTLLSEKLDLLFQEQTERHSSQSVAK